MDMDSPYKLSSFTSVLLVFYLTHLVRLIFPLSFIMDLARYEAMDAQRFDPMRRKNSPNPAISPVMGQIFRRLSQPELPPHDVVGGIWSDHELVLVPLEVSSQRNSFGSALAESLSSLSSSESPVSASSSTSSSSSYFTTPSPTAESGTHLNTSSPISSPHSTGSRQVDTFDRDDLIVTRTIIRPAGTQPVAVRGMFSRPSSPPISRRPTPTSPLSRPNTPVFQALNCFRPGAFETEWKDRGMGATQPVLQVIVTQTREQYEQDLAFKEVVHEVCPEASGRRRPIH